ncbi:beta-N-acetylhexosaminidase [Actinocrinis sp.]|uniref:beta-N-acetylhexosaminidase n=1 Tax=Actinocrinis sp. TaxID=1920516 RepID=UPI002D237E45|nr:beta-N-acetylhexosaminidase [Actinocrinis sp.]HZP54368.1 beta-N-acetylhexosaminidase [Actinocrinis sp.]
MPTPDVIDDLADLGLIPEPREVEVAVRLRFTLTDATVLDADERSAEVAGWLRSALGPATGLPLRDGHSPGNAITLRVADPATNTAGLGPEGYRLTVTTSGATLEAETSAGLFYAAQTLRTLLPSAAFRRAPISSGPWDVPAVTITDRPRFGWRGALLDVARHFLPKQDVLRFIDLIALHKLNVLHLHLTDDQGWRLEIRRYPRLTEVGSWRRESPLGDRRHDRFDGRPHGGFYTQDDIREIVAYAAARHITVVPEIDVPGHAGAAIAAYPHLGNTDSPNQPDQPEVATRWGILDNVLNAEESTLQFLRDVFDEVVELFPSKHIGVGGDECPTGPWENSPRAKGHIAERELPDADALRFWYVARLAEHLATHGRVLYGWDEICDGGLPADAVVASWRGITGAITAAKRGHDVVLCPEDQVYLDWRQSDDPGEPTPIGKVSSLAHVYAFEPVPAALSESEAQHVLGAQCNIWTEHIDSARAVDYMAFPRLTAFAETVWSDPRDRDFDDFARRLAVHERRLDALGVEYRRASGPLPWQSRPDAPGWPR